MYGIANCNTVKKAKDWLTENKIDFQFHDYKRLGASEEKLNNWFDVFGWESVINKAGLTYKKLDDIDKAKLDKKEKVLAYLINNTSAIKRPILEVNGKAVLIGFKEDLYRAYFDS
jgi:Spx/MgsR family transcriptional regulator